MRLKKIINLYVIHVQAKNYFHMILKVNKNGQNYKIDGVNDKKRKLMSLY